MAKKLVDVIHERLPGKKVLLLGAFPRGAKGSALREAVALINAVISKLDDGHAPRYLGIGHVFLDDNGEIPGDIMPDKLPPTSKGYDFVRLMA